MYELPLFPLNTVLFPGQPLNLHIFEERYKEMINLCIDTRQPFGVLLLESGKAELNPFARSEPIKPSLIGCTAVIKHVQRLAGGRLNITVTGQDRFKVHEFNHDKAYLVGLVEDLPLVRGDERVLASGYRALRQWVERYLAELERAGQIQPGERVLPAREDTLAYLSAVLLQGLPIKEKQTLLQMHSLSELINALRVAYRREVLLLHAMLTPPGGKEFVGPFSLN